MADQNRQRADRGLTNRPMWWFPFGIVAAVTAVVWAAPAVALEIRHDSVLAGYSPPAMWAAIAGSLLSGLLWYAWMRHRMVHRYGRSGDMIAVGMLAGLVTAPLGQLLAAGVLAAWPSAAPDDVHGLLTIGMSITWGLGMVMGLLGGVLWWLVARRQSWPRGIRSA